MMRRILRTPEAAQYLGLSCSTLEKKRLTGDGPAFVQLGGRAVGYDIAALDAWIDEQHGRVATHGTDSHKPKTSPTV